MTSIIDAARNNDFQAAKQAFDAEVSLGSNPLALLNDSDKRGRTVAHFAAEYDDVVVIEWLHGMGVDLLKKDDSNKSPIDIAVLVDAKLRRKHKTEGEVLPFLKRSVLNPIQQMFYLECGESTESVTGVSDLSTLSDHQLSERFEHHNNMQALHLFSMFNRVEELKYLKSRGVDLSATDDDGNTSLHFASSEPLADFLITECNLDVNARNTSDGHTPAHSVIERAAREEISEKVAVEILRLLVTKSADFAIKSDIDELGVAELAIEYFGPESEITSACLSGPGALCGKSLGDYLSSLTEDSDDESVSVASHDDKVLDEDGNASSSSEASSELSESEDEEEFFIRSK
jgi:ankyrin repeat protein